MDRIISFRNVMPDTGLATNHCLMDSFTEYSEVKNYRGNNE